MLIVAILHMRDTYSKSDINNNKSKKCNNDCLLADGLHDDRPEAAVPLPPVYPHVAILPPAGAPGVLQLPVVPPIAEVQSQLEILPQLLYQYYYVHNIF